MDGNVIAGVMIWTESIKETVFNQMELEGYGLILTHDIHPQTIEATNLILRQLGGGDRVGSFPFQLTR